MIQSNNIVISGITLYYRTAGDKQLPILVFLPAWGVKNGKTIPCIKIGKDSLIETLSMKFFVIDIEHPGLLRSQTPSPPWTFKEYANFYHKLFQQLGVKQFYLCGSSFGGGIASIYSTLFPQDVIALILTDSVVSNEYPVTQFVDRKRKFVVRILESKLAINSYMGTPMSSIDKEEIVKKLQMCKSFDSPSLYINYSEIKVPTVIIWGKDDKYVHPIEYGRDIAKKIAEAKLVEAEGAVEFMYVHPQKFLDYLIT